MELVCIANVDAPVRPYRLDIGYILAQHRLHIGWGFSDVPGSDSMVSRWTRQYRTPTCNMHTTGMWYAVERPGADHRTLADWGIKTNEALAGWEAADSERSGLDLDIKS